MTWKDSKTFCVYPWMHQMVQPSGTYSPCCVATPPPFDQTLSVSEHSFDEAFNSDSMKDMRQKMCDGEEVDVCKNCYYEEEHGRNSYRQRHNQEWLRRIPDIEKTIHKSIINNYEVDTTPAYLDLRLGNLCNLKCRMCNPWNSSQIFKETTELLETDKDFQEVWEQTYRYAPNKIEPWYENERFWEDIKAMAPTLKKVYMTGGEPTLIEKNYEFMQYLIDNGYTDIELFFNINCTNVKGRFLELISQFKNVNINVSIDGFGKTTEYIRYPSKWPTIKSNLMQLIREPNIKLGITPVLVAYNALSITEFLSFLDRTMEQNNRTFFIDLLINHTPYYNSVLVLPKEMRLEAASRIQTFIGNSLICNIDSFTRNSLQSAINILKSDVTDEKYSTEYRDQFVKYTRSLDNNRNTHLKDYEPELWKLLNDSGITI